MITNCLQFAMNGILTVLVVAGVIMAVPSTAGWLRTRSWLQFSPCKARLASILLVVIGVFLMANYNGLTGWFHGLATICFVVFATVGMYHLHQWKLWQKWHWPESCEEPPSPPKSDCCGCD